MKKDLKFRYELMDNKLGFKENNLYYYSDGIINNELPQYSLNIYPEYINCPFYNYILPDNYPKVEIPYINEKCYWYYPYDKYDWDTNSNIPKP